MTVFIDTAVIMYAAGRDHPLRDPSREILRAVVADELDGVTSAEVIQEILHRFTARSEPDVGANLARHALDVFAPVLPVTDAVMRRMPDLIGAHPGLSARDLVHVATCLEEGIDTIVSPDRGLEEVDVVQRIDPADL
ncbi:MAG: type II toxin-antitoxin system VapC family toxin [Nitriliruptorales bacterium]